MEIKVMKNILNSNQNKADEIKVFFIYKKALMVNLIGSPGAGKTTLLEKTMERLKDKYSLAVIEGDVATDRDARRLQKYNCPIVLINTDGACHLESISIQRALNEFDIEKPAAMNLMLKVHDCGIAIIETLPRHEDRAGTSRVRSAPGRPRPRPPQGRSPSPGKRSDKAGGERLPAISRPCRSGRSRSVLGSRRSCRTSCSPRPETAENRRWGS